MILQMRRVDKLVYQVESIYAIQCMAKRQNMWQWKAVPKTVNKVYNVLFKHMPDFIKIILN